MKALLFFSLYLLSVTGCKKNDTAPTDTTVAQNIAVLVPPTQTDAGYVATEQSHYVVRNTKQHLTKLLLFIGGSYSTPKDYNLICDYGATIGLDVISLSYPNNIAAAPLGSSSDQYVFDKYRDELCFGNPVSNDVDVNAFNCITTRATKLVQYLKTAYPDQNWQQYLTASGSILWSKVVVAGHSQGSGHACYIGKKLAVDRVVMLSGPNDYSSYYNAAANWLTQSGVTPLSKQFSLLHTQDEIVPFSNQVINLKGLGLLASAENPTAADNITTPYANAHALSVSIPAVSNHSSTVGANAKLPAIWLYMFTSL